MTYLQVGYYWYHFALERTVLKAHDSWQYILVYGTKPAVAEFIYFLLVYTLGKRITSYIIYAVCIYCLHTIRYEL